MLSPLLLEVVGVAFEEVEVVVEVLGAGATLTGTLVVVDTGVIEELELLVVGVEAVGVDEGSSSQSPSALPPVSPLLHATAAEVWH